MKKNSKNLPNLILYYYLPVVVWAIIIFTFSSSPAHPVSIVHWQDFVFKKIVHLTEYAIFTGLIFRSFKKSGIDAKKALYYSLFIAVFYGGTDEFHQSFTPTREPTVRDMLIDTAGSILMVLFISKILPKMPINVQNFAKKLDLI